MRRKGRIKHDNMRDKSIDPYNKAFIALFILFISLFAISEFNINSITKIINLFKTETNLSDAPEQALTEDPNFDISEVADDTDELPERDNLNDSIILNSREFDNLRLMQKNIESLIRENQLSGIIGTKLTVKGLHMLLYTDTIFEPGYANLQVDSGKLIEELARLITIHEQHELEVIVIGHADDLAIENEKLKSNWELSAMRAMQVMQILAGNIALRETEFSAKARGDKDPLIEITTKENDYRNRRIEIIVQPKSIS